MLCGVLRLLALPVFDSIRLSADFRDTGILQALVGKVHTGAAILCCIPIVCCGAEWQELHDISMNHWVEYCLERGRMSESLSEKEDC